MEECTLCNNYPYLTLGCSREECGGGLSGDKLSLKTKYLPSQNSNNEDNRFGTLPDNAWITVATVLKLAFGILHSSVEPAKV